MEFRKNQRFDRVFEEISGFQNLWAWQGSDFEKLTPHDGKKFGAPEDPRTLLNCKRKATVRTSITNWRI